MITPPAFANLQWKTYLIFGVNKSLPLSNYTANPTNQKQPSSTPPSSPASGSSSRSPKAAVWKSWMSFSPSRTRRKKTPSRRLARLRGCKVRSWSRSWRGISIRMQCLLSKRWCAVGGGIGGKVDVLVGRWKLLRVGRWFNVCFFA
jgi:hypothetical protein